MVHLMASVVERLTAIMVVVGANYLPTLVVMSTGDLGITIPHGKISNII